MAPAHASTASPTPTHVSPMMRPTSLRDRAMPGGSLRILLAERPASAHAELSRRLKSRGHEILARVNSAQGAIDYAGFLTPDVVLVSPLLDDAPGLTVAMAVARKQPGVAAVVFTSHPAAANPAFRPNWGPVALLPIDANADEMHEELWRAVIQAREASAPAESPAVDDADTIEDPTVVDMVDALYAPPAIELVTTPVVPGVQPSMPMQESDDEIIARATSALVERARLTRITAMRLMEQEASDSGQSVAEVARAMLFDVESDTIEVLSPAE
jgi:ActR/RegA family two-component response regulator